MNYDLRDLARIVAIVCGVLFLVGIGLIIGHWRPVTPCAEYAAPANATSLHVPVLPSGSDGVKCVTIRGMFEGPPSGWRYVGMPDGDIAWDKVRR